MRTILLFVLLISLFMVEQPVKSAEPIRIGVSLGLTGQYQLPAEMHKRAYQICEEDINSRGGLVGHPISIDIRDDESSASKAKQIYEDFLATGKVDFVFGPYSSDLTGAVAPIAETYGFPMLAPGAAADRLWRHGYRNLVGVLTPASRYGIGILRLANEVGYRRIALLHADDNFAQEIAAGIRKWAPFLKLQISLDMSLPEKDGTSSSLGNLIHEASPDIVVVAGYFGEAARVRRALAMAQWQPHIFFATVGPSLPSWPLDLGELADGAFTTSIWEPSAPASNLESKNFAAGFTKKFGVVPSYHAAAAYSACQIFEAAITQTASLDKNLYRDALFAMDRNTILGRFAVDSTGIQVKRYDLVVQWIKGRKEIVWPQDKQTAAPVFEGPSP